MNFVVNKQHNSPVAFRMMVHDVFSRDKVTDFTKRLCQILELPYGYIQKNELQFIKILFSKTAIAEQTGKIIDIENVEEGNREREITELYASEEGIKNESVGIDAEQWSPDEHEFSGEIISYIPGRELAVQYKQGDQVLLLILLRVVAIVGIGGFLLYFFTNHLFLNISIVIAFFDATREYKKANEKKLFDPDEWYFNLQQKTIHRTLRGESLEYDMTKANKVLFYKITTKSESSDSEGRTETTYSYKSAIKLQGVGETGYLKIGETPKNSSSDETYKSGFAFANFISKMLEIPVEFCETSSRGYDNIDKSHNLAN